MAELPQIPWSNYAAANIINNEQLEMIYRMDQVKDLASKAMMFQQSEDEYVMLFTVLLNQVSTKDTCMNIISTLDGILEHNPLLGTAFHRVLYNGDCDTDLDPFPAFKKVLLRKSDTDLVSQAASVYGRIIGMDYDPSYLDLDDEALEFSQHMLEDHLIFFLQWITKMMSAKTEDGTQSPAAINALQTLLTHDTGRIAFANTPGSLEQLTKMVLNVQSQAQMLYQVIFVVWALSYNAEIAERMANMDMIINLATVCRTSTKEKVIRVSCSTLINMLDKGKCNELMINAGWIKILNTLKQRKMADEDIVDDVQTLLAALEKNVQEMSSFEVYKREVLSGDLEWSPVHKNPTFWATNAAKVEGDVLKELVKIVQNTSGDHKSTNLQLEVACHDIGEFVRFHQSGKTAVTNLGAKAALMELLEDQCADVRKQALTAVQKLMVTNWEFLNFSK